MMKKIISTIMSVAMLICALSPMATNSITAKAAETATGTTYYVSTLNGSDRNSGTDEDQPFYSLQKINDITLQPGDKVLLQAGSVFTNGYLHIKGSGSEEAPIQIGKYGTGNDPVIAANGQGVWYQNYKKSLDSSSHRYKGYVSSSILLYDVEYIEISDIEITNDDVFSGVNYSELTKMNRTGVAAVAKDNGTLDHIYLNNLYIHDVDGNVYDKHMNNGGIYFTVFKPDNDTVTGVAKYNDVKIENCHVENVSRWGIAVGYTSYYDKFSATAIPDSVSETYGSTNVVIRNNFVSEVGGDAITTMYCHRPLIEYNVSDGAAKEINTTIYSATGSGRVAAAIWPWKCKDAVFQYNEAYDTYTNQDGQAWDADSGDGTIYQYNYSHNNGGGCVMFCVGQAYQSVFRYNISQNDLGGTLNLPSHPLAKIYNNVFYIGEGTPFIRNGMTGGTATVENNIIYNAGAKKTEDWIKNCKMTYSNNIYYNYNNTPVDAAAITADPKFVNPGSGPTQPLTGGLVHSGSSFSGYKLLAGSPALGAGKVQADNGGRDFFGNTLGTTVNIGAYEGAGLSEAPEMTKIQSFVSRLYTEVLGRDAEEEGMQYYDGLLTSGKLTGADTAKGFFFSDEFRNRNLSNEAYTEVLYRTLMGRDSDTDGMEYWLNYLDNGVTREFVFRGFVESMEYTEICSDAGIVRGDYALPGYVNQKPELTMFVNRLYAKALGRTPEEGGLEYYAREISEDRVTPVQAAQNFIFSQEFKDKKLDDSQYVKVLYQTFMGREYDEAGLNYHVDRMEKGVSREDILLGFAYSPEFEDIMSEFGLE
ncbi:DUF4214 domain-containing protein [Anaerobium acetethylicum]|uniref:DUF4214 domain-containing protein n=1 Tax=Anaerobium acetethylicum TaxID=1619234 RepID=A0A1D3TPW4_9FIRM|nr:DUF4214 domain-containing protein [Anaerobium acetethylicum]SCP95481.1 protein of unknown function [Anaerobium acetethylicum]